MPLLAGTLQSLLRNLKRRKMPFLLSWATYFLEKKPKSIS
jgi:hypothetical protein